MLGEPAPGEDRHQDRALLGPVYDEPTRLALQVVSRGLQEFIGERGEVEDALLLLTGFAALPGFGGHDLPFVGVRLSSGLSQPRWGAGLPPAARLSRLR